CLSRIDARRLKDRSLLGTFREHLSQARRHAAALAGERARIFVDYQLRVRPSINKRRPRAATEGEDAEAAAADAEDRTTGAAARRSAQQAAAARKGAAPSRPPRVRAASGARPPPRRAI